MEDKLNTTWTAEWTTQNNGSLEEQFSNTTPPQKAGAAESNSNDIDRLTDSGIFRHGYGLIPKYAMQDRKLTLTAKSIYAYLCTLCGGGETAFPGVETIRTALKLGKDSYYQHRKLLEDTGYITVQRRHQGKNYTTNLYTLNENPRHFQQETGKEWQDRIFAAVHFSGLRSAGYGILPRSVMTDTRLDAKAKAIYAYFVSFTGAGIAAFPSRSRLLQDLNISKTAYYKYLEQLKEAEYLLVVQKSINLRFSINEYYLLDSTAKVQKSGNADQEALNCGKTETENQKNRITVNPCPKKPDVKDVEKPWYDVENRITVNPCPKKPDVKDVEKPYFDVENPDFDVENRITVNPCPNFPCIINPDTTINKIYINSLYPIYPLTRARARAKNLPEILLTTTDRTNVANKENKTQQTTEEDKIPENRNTDQPKQPNHPLPNTENHIRKHWPSTSNTVYQQQTIKQKLKQSINYHDIPVMYPELNMALIDNLIDLMASILCNDNTNPSLQIGKQTYNRANVKDKFMSLNAEHLRYVLECVQNKKEEIRNLRAYYLTALLNAADTMDLYYQRQVDLDMEQEKQCI